MLKSIFFLSFAILCILINNSFSVVSSPFIETKNLKRGMLLEGKTRMASNVMTSFDLIILSVLKGRNPQGDAILAQIQTPLFEETGVLAGMSGSPVYYHGKLVGAVSFTMTFTKKPIVGITPIHAMLRLLEYSKKDNANLYMDTGNIYGLKPIATPLGIAGSFYLEEETVKSILEWDNLLMIPLSVNEVAKESSLRESNQRKSIMEGDTAIFEPGDAVGVSLVSGDITMSALGTVTYVSNDHVLAFGHPFGHFGKVNFPLHQAEVDAIIPMLSLSFKVGSLGPEVGSLTEDRSTAVLGVVGHSADKVPFHLAFKSPLQNKKFTYWVTTDENYFSPLVAMLSVNSLVFFESTSEEATFYYEIRLETDYYNKSVRIIDMISSENTMEGSMNIANHLRQVIQYIENNDFLPIEIKKIELDVSVASKLDYYYLIEAIADKKRYQPAEKVFLRLIFENYRRGQVTHEVIFSLPNDLKDGTHLIMVTSGTDFLSLDVSRNRAKYIPRHPEGLFELLNEDINRQTVSVFMLDSSHNAIVSGQPYRNLPQFIIDSLVKSHSQDKSILSDFYRHDFKMPGMVIGTVKLDIDVERDIYSSFNKTK